MLMSTNVLVEAAAEWGCAPTARRLGAMADLGHGPMNEAVYVRLVRRELSRLRPDIGAEAVVLAAGFGQLGQLGIAPRRWAGMIADHAEAWAAKCRYVCVPTYRPDQPHLVRSSKSPHDPSPRALAVGTAAGIPAERLRDLAVGTPGGRREAWLLARLGRKLRGGGNLALRYDLPGGRPRLPLGELERLNRLSGAFLRAVSAHGPVDLSACAAALPAWRALHANGTAAALRAMRIPANLWLDWTQPGSRWLGHDRWPLDQRLALVELGRRGVSLIVRPEVDSPGLCALAAAPWAAHLGAGVTKWHLHYAGQIAAARAAGLPVPEPTAAQAASEHQLRELVDAAGLVAADGTAHAHSGDRERQALGRALDRAAQRAPEWAIRGWRYEYDRGRRLAPVLGAALAGLTRLLDEGHTLFIHGRDGEILRDLLARHPRRAEWKGRVRYALTSRPLTVEGRGALDSKYEAYLEKVCPRALPAIHVDTGFAGSIPRWFQRQRWTVQKLALLHAEDSEDALPETVALASRDLVLAEIEHSLHRLEKPRRWGEIEYSSGAPGYWARLYGVADALGLPRRVKR